MPAQSSTIDLVEIIKQDYQNFPNKQTYSIYAENVYFEDPLNKLQGIARYQKMISFLGCFFQNIDLKLHNIAQDKNIISFYILINSFFFCDRHKGTSPSGY